MESCMKVDMVANKRINKEEKKERLRYVKT